MGRENVNDSELVRKELLNVLSIQRFKNSVTRK